MAENDKKPGDWLENFAGRDFDGGSNVDVATVDKNADPSKLLFKPGEEPPSGAEDGGDDTFIWDETPEIVTKYGQAMWRTDLKVGEKTFRYWGKTRTDVTRQLIKAQVNASQTIEELKRKQTESPTPTLTAKNPNLVPDTKLPYDPIPRKSPRNLSNSDIMQLQELRQTDPLMAARIEFEALTGYTPEAFAQVAERVDNAGAKRIADEAAFQFQAEMSEEWDPTPGNVALINTYLSERKWPVTLNNLKIAFYDLVAQKRLTMPKAEDAPASPVSAVPPVPEVEEVPPPPPPVSIPNIPARSGSVKTEADKLREDAALLQTMPLDRARELLAEGFRKQRAGR